MKAVRITLLLFELALFLTTSLVQGNDCYLSKKPAEQAFPSLIKCYRNNAEACCVSSHDSSIGSDMGNFLSSSCERRFQELELYFCYGCHYSEPTSTITTNSTIKLCYDFAMRLWGADLAQSSTKFDHCGMSTFWRSTSSIVIPSKEWASGYAFFSEVKPPLFTDFTIEIRLATEGCYNDARESLLPQFVVFFASLWLLGIAFLF